MTGGQLMGGRPTGAWRIFSGDRPCRTKIARCSRAHPKILHQERKILLSGTSEVHIHHSTLPTDEIKHTSAATSSPVPCLPHMTSGVARSRLNAARIRPRTGGRDSSRASSPAHQGSTRSSGLPTPSSDMTLNTGRCVTHRTLTRPWQGCMCPPRGVSCSCWTSTVGTP